MRMNRLRKGQLLFNKVNGRNYRIAEKDDTKGIGICENPETGELDEKDLITVKEENAICFRLIENPCPTEIPDGFYLSEDGYLMKDGKHACEQGTLVFKKILCEMKGYLVLETETRHHHAGKSDIFSYCPELDSFRKLAGNLADGQDIIFNYQDKIALIGRNCYEEKEVEEQGIKKKIDEYIYTELTVISTRKAFTLKHYRLLQYWNNDLFVVPDKNNEDVFSILIRCDMTHNIDGKEFADPVAYQEILFSSDSIEIGEVIETGEIILAATRCQLDNQLFIRTEHQFIWDSEVIKHENISYLSRFDFLVDVEWERTNLKMVVADYEYHICRLERKSTNDRGDIVLIFE